MAKFLREIDTGDVSPADLIDRAIARGLFVFDLETTGLDPLHDRIEGVAAYVPEGHDNVALSAWFPFTDATVVLHVQPDETLAERRARINHDRMDTPESELRWRQLRQEPILRDLRPAMNQREVMEALRPLFENPSLTAVGANVKFDTGFLKHSSGGDSPIVVLCKLADSMLLDFLADENDFAYGLKHRVEKLFGHKMVTYEEAARLRRQSVLSFMADTVQPLGIYAQEDVYWTWELYKDAWRRIDKQSPDGSLEKLFWGIDMKIARILEEMENAGVLIDHRWLREVSKKLEVEKQACLTRIEARSGTAINPGSAQQVSGLLFGPKEQGNLGLSTAGIKRGKTGMFSTGSKDIGHLRRADPIVADILDYRSHGTVQTSFAKKLADLAQASPDARIRTHFIQTGTKIYRLASADPFNAQNIPRDRELIRKAFCAHFQEDEDYITKLTGDEQAAARAAQMIQFGTDLSQIELRVACHLSHDPAMTEVYLSGGKCGANEGGPCERFQHWYCDDCDKAKRTATYLPVTPQDGTQCPRCGGKKIKHQKRCRHVDLHQRTSEDVQIDRDPLSKNANFGLLYGMGAERFCQYSDLYDEHGVARIGFAEELIEAWFETYTHIRPFHERWGAYLRVNDWVAQTITGRQRRLSGERWKNEHRAIFQGVQFAVSGSAQDIIKTAMIRIIEERDRHIANDGPAAKKLWRQVKILLQVHDELQGVTPHAIKDEVKEMVGRHMIAQPKSNPPFRVPLEAAVKLGRSWDDCH